MATSKTDVLIIGAGPSGSISAAYLIKKGYSVTVVEKSKFPRFVIGESLLPKCMEILEEVDLLETVEAQNFQKKHGAKFLRGNETCDFDFSEQFTDGWNWTWQVPRAEFDSCLINEVENRGAKVLYQHEVTAVEFIKKGQAHTTVKDLEGNITVFESKFIIDGSGYGRVLPRLLNLDTPSNLPPRSAFFSHFNEPDRAKDEASVRIQAFILEPELWSWVIPLSGGRTSVGFVGDLTKLENKEEKDYRNLLIKHPYLSQRFKELDVNFKPTFMTAYSSSVKQFHGQDYVLTGNSTEFLDPIFSSGVTFALESGLRAANLVDRELKDQTVDWNKEYVEHILQGVEVFRTFVTKWYDGTLHKVFFAEAIDTNIKNQICSVLAGYVWDNNNPFVKKHKRVIDTLVKVIDISATS